MSAAGETRGPSKRRWPRRLLALVLAMVSALLLCEALLRTSMSDLLGFPAQMRGMFVEDHGSLRLAPGFSGRLTVQGRTSTVRINALGLRGPELGPKAPTERRVLCLGDSFVFGHGVAEEEALPARLEAILRQRRQQAVVVGNAGTPGHGTVDSIATLRHLAPSFRPDLVLAFVFPGNDFIDNFVGDKHVVAGYMVDGPFARLLESSLRARLALRWRTAYVIERFLSEHLPFLAMDRSAMAMTEAERREQAGWPPPPQRGAGLFMDATLETPPLRRLMDRAVEALARLRDLARPAPLLVVLLPAREQVVPGLHAAELRRMGLDPQAYRPGLAHQRLVRRCEDLGMPCMDLREGLRAAPEPAALYIPRDGHFSVAGHERAARLLAPRVLAALPR